MKIIGYSFCDGTEVWTAQPHKDHPQFYMIYRYDEYIMEAPFEGEPTERDIVTIRKAFYAGIQHINYIWARKEEEKETEAEEKEVERESYETRVQGMKMVPDDRAKM